MILRIALFTLMAAGLLGFGTVAWISTWPPAASAVASTSAPPPPPAKVAMLVAVHPLRAGSFLKGEDLRAQEFMAGQSPQGASADTPEQRRQLQGAMLRHSIGEGQAVLAEDILRSGDHGFLAAVLEPGMRAMTFGVGDVASDWALVWPGDRVDVILTHQFDNPATLAGRRFAAETIMSDIRVVAVDQQLMQGEMASDAERKTQRTLTVEVSPEQAERLALAVRLGRLSIALRAAMVAVPASVNATLSPESLTRTALATQVMPASLTDATESTSPAVLPPPPPPQVVTWSGDVAHALNQPTRPAEPSVIRVFRGAEDGKEFKF